MPAVQVVRAAEDHLRHYPDEVPTVLVDMPYSMIVLDTRECASLFFNSCINVEVVGSERRSPERDQH